MSGRSPAFALILFSFVLPFPAAVAAADLPEKDLTLEETQARLQSQVSVQLKVAAEDIQVTEAEARTWPDASLGCEGRRRLMGRSPVQGYRFVLAVGEKRFTYHADTRGSFRRCDAPGKPLGPIAE